MTRAIEDSSEQLKIKTSGTKAAPGSRGNNVDISTAILEVKPEGENLYILLEMVKFFGRDMNVLECYNLFGVILRKGSKKYSSADVKQMFLQALRELKYMGYISQTRQSTFIFKKNYFGKARLPRVIQKTEAQLEQEKRDI